jgi:hypothetical protein
LSRTRFLAVASIAIGLLLLSPEAAWAWGPATHVHTGVEILRSLDLLPTHVAGLLAQYPIDFLYGNIAADISVISAISPPTCWPTTRSFPECCS